MRKVFLAVWLLSLTVMATAQQTMDNNAVIKLSQAGFSDELIVSTINDSPGNYDTSVNGLIVLKEAGISEKVLATIMAKAASRSTTTPASNTATASSGVTTRIPQDVNNKVLQVPIWIQVAGASGGFTSANKDLSDSVNDVKNRIKGSKILSQASTKQDALVIVEIISRDVRYKEQTGVLRGSRQQDNKADTTTLIARVIVGDYEEEFRADGNAQSWAGAWREAASALVQNLERWVKENYNQLTRN